MQAVLENIGGANDSAVPTHSTATSKPSSTVKKPTHPVKVRPHSDSDDNNESDDIRVIKSVPGHSKTTKGATGGPSRSMNLIADFVNYMIFLFSS